MEGDKGAGRLIHTSIFSSPPELTKLTALIESLNTPEDNSDYHTWLSRCWLTPQSAAYPIFKELVDYFMEETGGHRNCKSKPLSNAMFFSGLEYIAGR